MLLSETWEKYKSDKRIEGYSSLTLKMYGFQCNFLRRYFGDIRMVNVTTEKLNNI